MMTLRLHRYTKSLLIFFTVFAAFLAALCILLLGQIQESNETAEKLNVHSFAVSNASREAKEVLILIRERVRDALLSRDQEKGEFIISEIALLDDIYFKNLETISELNLGGKDDAAQAEQLFKKLRSTREVMLGKVLAGDFDGAQAMLAADAPAYEEIFSKLEGMVEFSRTEAAFFSAEARRQAAQTQETVYLIMALGFAACLTCGIYVLRTVQTALCQNEVVIDHKAHHDPLTGLPNRTLLRSRLREAINMTRTSGSSVGVMFINLDDFKAINDRLGHDAGDELLVLTARRLTAALRGGDTVARIGGDEFVVVFAGIKDRTAVGAVADKLLRVISEPVSIKDVAFQVGASIGLAATPEDGSDPDVLMAGADAAMHLAKNAARDGKHA